MSSGTVTTPHNHLVRYPNGSAMIYHNGYVGLIPAERMSMIDEYIALHQQIQMYINLGY